MRATLDGTIHTVLSEDSAAPADLPAMFMPGKPVVWIVAADNSAPSEWKSLSEMQLWGCWAAVHSVRPSPLDYQVVIQAALHLDRAIFVQTSPKHHPAWALALAPILSPRSSK